MEIPVMIKNRKAGSAILEKRPRGWQVSLSMENIGRVARLYIFGSGEKCYLGIPEPESSGSMTLQKMLDTLPAGPVCCGEEPPEEKPQPQREKSPAHVVWMGGRPYYF